MILHFKGLFSYVILPAVAWLKKKNKFVFDVCYLHGRRFFSAIFPVGQQKRIILHSTAANANEFFSFRFGARLCLWMELRPWGCAGRFRLVGRRCSW